MLDGDSAFLRQEFRLRFNIELPQEFTEKAMHEVGLGRLFLSTATGKSSLYLLAGDVNEFVVNAPMGYQAVGFWGHGANSYAFYFASKGGTETIYLRLHTGGAYSDPVKAASDISDYLPPFLELWRRARGLNGRLTAIESMGFGQYQFELDSQISTVNRSLLGRPDCNDEFEALTSTRDESQVSDDDIAVARIRETAIKLAQRIYDIEMRRVGNPRVGMRAMGAAIDVVRMLSTRTSARQFRHELFWALSALRERHRDLDGQHDYARSCIDQLMGELRQSV